MAPVPFSIADSGAVLVSRAGPSSNATQPAIALMTTLLASTGRRRATGVLNIMMGAILFLTKLIWILITPNLEEEDYGDYDILSGYFIGWIVTEQVGNLCGLNYLTRYGLSNSNKLASIQKSFFGTKSWIQFTWIAFLGLVPFLQNVGWGLSGGITLALSIIAGGDIVSYTLRMNLFVWAFLILLFGQSSRTLRRPIIVLSTAFSSSQSIIYGAALCYQDHLDILDYTNIYATLTTHANVGAALGGVEWNRGNMKGAMIAVWVLAGVWIVLLTWAWKRLAWREFRRRAPTELKPVVEGVLHTNLRRVVKAKRWFVKLFKKVPHPAAVEEVKTNVVLREPQVLDATGPVEMLLIEAVPVEAEVTGYDLGEELDLGVEELWLDAVDVLDELDGTEAAQIPGAFPTR